jgi:ubiquinone/menaquinone biosynthesis C-methylase UbiE
MIPRILEPEVMDSPDEARDYDAMDHAAVNDGFVEDFRAVLMAARRDSEAGSSLTSIIDVGTGTALIPIVLAQREPGCSITAVDMSQEMLKLAVRNVATAQLTGTIRLQIADAKTLPFADDAFDAGISNSILHHLPEPAGPLAEMARVVRPGGVLFVRDLLRPETSQALDHLVEMHASNEAPHARRMLQESLHAAYTLDEVRKALASIGLPTHWVTQTSDRHWTIAGRLA